MKSQVKSLNTIVNSSGFLYQLRIEKEIRENIIAPDSRWKIVGREHRWVNPATGNEGFIDLLLDTGILILVIECKRVTEGRWIFLVPEGSYPMQRARLLWTHVDSNKSVFDWSEFKVNPISSETMFCVVRGQGEKDVPMLERLASTLLLSAEALSVEDIQLKSNGQRSKQRVFMPMIITNADLYECKFDSALIDIATGRTDSTEFQPIPFIRFRKSLASGIPSRTNPDSIHEANIASERTVFIVNSNYLRDTFNELNLPYEGYWPWSNL